MYCKLALRNVKKSYRDFLIYFLTLSFSVCLFYTFNSFQEQAVVINLERSQEDIIRSLASTMTALSVFVIIVLGFLMLYANNFLIKRRKKEFGIYMLLGMPKSKISRVLVYETLIIGIVSLITGILAGFFLSQILSVLTANMFEATLNYHFVFSPSGLIITLIAFLCIFLFLMVLNSFILNRYKLIQLIQAKQRNEKSFVNRLWISVLLFIVSLGCIGAAYYLALYDKLNAFGHLNSIITLGSLGTLLFFLSLSGFLLSVIKTSKRFYYKNVNCFVLRQLNNSINTNFLSMSVICIMLLLSIGALATGLNLKETFNRSLNNIAPYDVSYQTFYINTSEQEILDQSFDVKAYINQLNLNPAYVKSASFINAYRGVLNFKEHQPILTELDDLAFLNEIQLDDQLNVVVLPLSSYNQVLEHIGQKKIALRKDEVYYYNDLDYIRPYMEKVLVDRPAITLFNKSFHIKNKTYQSYQLNTTRMTYGYHMVVMHDEDIPSNSKKQYAICNFTLTDRISHTAFQSELEQSITQVNNELSKQKTAYPSLPFIENSDNIKADSVGSSVMFTYIGIYLGIVFLIASAVILALQQLSHADEDKYRYMILNKIGIDKKMQNKAVFLQIGSYFLLPLLLAIIHSVVGIQMVNSLSEVYGKGDILQASLITGCIFIAVYGAYFSLTYVSYKNIIKHNLK